MLAALCAVGLFHFLYLTLLTIKRFHDAGKSTLYCLGMPVSYTGGNRDRNDVCGDDQRER